MDETLIEESTEMMKVLKWLKVLSYDESVNMMNLNEKLYPTHQHKALNQNFSIDIKNKKTLLDEQIKKLSIVIEDLVPEINSRNTNQESGNNSNIPVRKKVLYNNGSNSTENVLNQQKTYQTGVNRSKDLKQFRSKLPVRNGSKI